MDTTTYLQPAEFAPEKTPHQISDTLENSGDLPRPPIPLFTPSSQSHRSRSHGKKENFFFLGYFTLKTVRYLKPQSEELVEMLKTKFADGKERTSENWRASLNMPWAAVELEKVEVDSESPMVPLKAMMKKNKKEEKGVTEMLEDLRLGEAALA